ncbi:MAG: YcgL domain-containing protein [Stenotrophobium sp.]
MNSTCIAYRCARQNEMYLYVRTGLDPDTLPQALLRSTGKLTQVMELDLNQRKLARVDTGKVLQALHESGYFLQMPPANGINGHLDDGG